MKLSEEDIKNIAHLARLKIDTDDVAFYIEELSAILDYIEQLNEVDTTDAHVTSHVTGLHTISREDTQRSGSGRQRGDMAASLIQAVPFLEKGLVKVRSVFQR